MLVNSLAEPHSVHKKHCEMDNFITQIRFLFGLQLVKFPCWSRIICGCRWTFCITKPWGLKNIIAFVFMMKTTFWHSLIPPGSRGQDNISWAASDWWEDKTVRDRGAWSSFRCGKLRKAVQAWYLWKEKENEGRCTVRRAFNCRAALRKPGARKVLERSVHVQLSWFRQRWTLTSTLAVCHCSGAVQEHDRAWGWGCRQSHGDLSANTVPGPKEQ